MANAQRTSEVGTLLSFYWQQIFNDNSLAIMLRHPQADTGHMTRLDIKSKADIRFFTYYLVNGTLDVGLINSQLQTDPIDFMTENPNLFFESFCVFANHKQRTPDINPMNTRVAEFICHSIEPGNFQHVDNFQNWELNVDFDGNDFTNCLKDFAYRLSFDKIDKLTSTNHLFKNCISYGPTFWETVFVIWANNLAFENDKITNQEYAIDRAALWFTDVEKVEEWEIELEI